MKPSHAHLLKLAIAGPNVLTVHVEQSFVLQEYLVGILARGMAIIVTPWWALR
jgi:hypothetical protein